MVRAMIFAGKIPDSGDLNDLKKDFYTKISCAGSPLQTQPCAVNDGSFFSHDRWFIMITGAGISYDKNPVWSKGASNERDNDESDEEEKPK